MRTSIGLGLGAVVCALIPGISNAQGSSDAATAQVLYDSATQLMDDNKIAEACPKLEEVTRLVPDGLGAKLTLAECYERAGKLASAWSQYASVAEAAARTGQAARHDRAAEKAAGLKPHLATITLHVSDAVKSTPGLTVKRDGQLISSAQWEERIPVDAGSHLIEIEAPGKVAWKREVSADHDGMGVSIAVDALGNEDPASKPGHRAWQRPTGYAVGGVGLAALGVGFAMGAVAMSKASDADDQCSASLVCTQRGLDLRHEGRHFGNAATALIVVGAASAVTGIVLVVSAPKAQRTELAVSPGFMSVRGRF